MSDKLGIAFVSGWLIFWLIWLGLKVIALPILIVNIIYLISAVQANSVNTFDFGWLVISAFFVMLL